MSMRPGSRSERRAGADSRSSFGPSLAADRDRIAAVVVGAVHEQPAYAASRNLLMLAYMHGVTIRSRCVFASLWTSGA